MTHDEALDALDDLHAATGTESGGGVSGKDGQEALADRGRGTANPFLEDEAGLLGPVRPHGGERRKPSLSDCAIDALRERFANFQHNPSKEHWNGLAVIAAAIEDMAEGVAQPKYLYSSLATGMGKTSVLLEMTRQILADPAYNAVGIVVFARQLEHIDRMVEELGLAPDKFAVVVGKGPQNEKRNAMGRGCKDHKNAQVLFTTQAKFLMAASYRHSRDFDTFWLFNGRPRQVRVWDEAIMPAEPLMLVPADIEELAGQLELNGNTKFAKSLRDLSANMIEAAGAGRGTFDIPYMYEIVDLIADLPDDLFSLDSPGDILLRMSGQVVRLFQDPSTNVATGTTITYREQLPKNLAPMLILDASGDLRVTYKAWELGRGDLAKLYSPPKTYRNLTIHHWDRAAGKAVYRDNADRDELAAAAVNAFFSVPRGEKVLVVVRKAEKPYANLIEQIRRRVRAEGGDPELFEVVTWGRHTGSNAWQDIRHVIVLGVLQYNPAMNEAHWRAAAGASSQDDVDWAKVEDLRKGEIAQNLFQAVGRGAVRKCVNGDVPDGCTLHIVFSTLGRMGTPVRVLQDCFPGAVVKRWTPLGAQLVGGALKTKERKRFFDALMRRLGDRAEVGFELREMGEAFGPSKAFRFIKDPAIREALAEKGVRVEMELVKRARAKVARYTLRREEGGPVAPPTSSPPPPTATPF